MSKNRRNHSPEFKAEVALEALRGDKTVSDISATYAVHQTLINKWKRTLTDQAPSIFSRHNLKDTTELYRLIDDLCGEIEKMKIKNTCLMEIIKNRTDDIDSM